MANHVERCRARISVEFAVADSSIRPVIPLELTGRFACSTCEIDSSFDSEISDKTSLDDVVLGAVSELCANRVKVPDDGALDYDEQFKILIPELKEATQAEREIAIQLVRSKYKGTCLDCMVGMLARSMEKALVVGATVFDIEANGKDLRRYVPMDGYDTLRTLQYLQEKGMATYQRPENVRDGIGYRLIDHPTWHVLLTSPQFRDLVSYVHAVMRASSQKLIVENRHYDRDAYRRLFYQFVNAGL